jgi:hypothetical protein
MSIVEMAQWTRRWLRDIGSPFWTQNCSIILLYIYFSIGHYCFKYGNKTSGYEYIICIATFILYQHATKSIMCLPAVQNCYYICILCQKIHNGTYSESDLHCRALQVALVFYQPFMEYLLPPWCFRFDSGQHSYGDWNVRKLKAELIQIWATTMGKHEALAER